MKRCLTIYEVRSNVEYTLERMKNQKKAYTYKEIDSIYKKYQQKYIELYNNYCNSSTLVNLRKVRSFSRRYDWLV